MALLKEDSSLDIERINKLPIKKHMKAIGSLTREQFEQYISTIPINESKDYPRAIRVEAVDGVDANEFMNKMRKNMGENNETIPNKRRYMIKGFKRLSEAQQAQIYYDYMNADFDHDISFAIIDADKEILGYALLKRESIETTKPSVEFENSQYGCKLVKIRTLQDNDNGIFIALAKKCLDRIAMWYDNDTDSQFDHLWGIFDNEPDAHLFADTVVGEKAECLIDSVKKYLVYTHLEHIIEMENAPE